MLSRHRLDVAGLDLAEAAEQAVAVEGDARRLRVGRVKRLVGDDALVVGRRGPALCGGPSGP